MNRICLRCSAPLGYRRQRVCGECSGKRWIETRYMTGAALAQSLVAKARRAGKLADPRTLPCADCHGHATEYDHRDYNFPLIVEPVCRGCNARRGHAITKRWTASEWAAYVARSQIARANRLHAPLCVDGAPTAESWQIERAA